MSETEVTNPSYEYLSCAETAKLVRKALAREFPGVKFSVRSHTYAGGAAIDVKWSDGPSVQQFDEVVQGFRGGRFDGMIDMAYNVSSWLEEDGTAHVAGSPGTTGSRGVDAPVVEDPRTGGARLVHFGADYVSGVRELSFNFLASMLKGAQEGRVGWSEWCKGCNSGKVEDVAWRFGGDRVDDWGCSPECAVRIAAWRGRC